MLARIRFSCRNVVIAAGPLAVVVAWPLWAATKLAVNRRMLRDFMETC